MTTYHISIWDWNEVSYSDPRYIHYPVLVIERGLKAKVTAYIAAAYDNKPLGFPPVDLKRSKWIDHNSCDITMGGMVWTGWTVEQRWRTFDNLMSIEVGCHSWLEETLLHAMIHSDKKNHSDWVMINSMTWRVVFKRTTAEKILAYIALHREELRAWDGAYNDAFNKNIDEMNDSGRVLISHRGAPGPKILTNGPSEEL